MIGGDLNSWATLTPASARAAEGVSGGMFETVLIANRGEIALRIVRTCREMGIRAVVAYSTADRESAAVRAADGSVHIGPAPSRRSYLYPPALIEAALGAGAQAVHPGYGFLAEDPDFAQICRDSGLAFIGPPAEVLSRLGDKSLARKLLGEAGLPVLPGSDGPVASLDEAVEQGGRIGLPLIVKAVAGGGGRGMTIVRTSEALATAFTQTRAKAAVAFGDDRVYLERFLERARHIEVQVLADEFGTVVSLGERDCSVQRRHQKLIEESPAAGLAGPVARRLAEYAVRGARAVGYVGAGTFEFLVNGDGEALIEVNCRIQVEHPVTEAVTGVDMVREQILVAAGRPLSFAQDDIVHAGVAIECRVNAEDPERDFMPCPGRIDSFQPPAGPFVRVDTHAFPGYEIPPGYDSLLAKVVVWAPDRGQALARMRRAMAEFRIEGRGLCTTTELVREVLTDPDFTAARHTTDFMNRFRSTGAAGAE